MRAMWIISFLVIYYSGGAHADITLLYDVLRGAKTQTQYKVLLKPDRVRLLNRASNRQDFMLDLKSGDIVQLNKQQKSYFTINSRTLNQYVSLYRQNQGLFQGLIEQGMAQLDPQQRAKMDRLMQHLNAPDAKTAGFDLRPRKAYKKMFGVSCQIIGMWQGKQHLRDICLADYRDLQFAPADMAAFEKLKQLVTQFRHSPSGQQDALGMMADGLESLQGLPLEVVEFSADGKIRQVIRLASISLRRIADDAFRIPPDYQQKSMPQM